MAKKDAPARLAEGSSARDLIAWAQGRTPEQELKRLRRCAPQASLDDIFDMSRQRGACVFDSLDDLPSEEVTQKSYPRPAGYAAQTRVHLYDLMAPALLDSGATVSAIPEEVLCFILSYFQTLGQESDVSDAQWPIQRIERYTSPTSVTGLGRGSAMQTRYAVVLRVSSVSVGGALGWRALPRHLLQGVA